MARGDVRSLELIITFASFFRVMQSTHETMAAIIKLSTKRQIKCRALLNMNAQSTCREAAIWRYCWWWMRQIRLETRPINHSRCSLICFLTRAQINFCLFFLSVVCCRTLQTTKMIQNTYNACSRHSIFFANKFCDQQNANSLSLFYSENVRRRDKQ